MKRIIVLLMLLAFALCAVPAGAELGFAEVNRDQVNLRETPDGKRITYLDQRHSVFVFEEKQVDGQLWCHVYTHVNKRTRDAWIRGDMLRFVSDEFTNIVSVQAGDQYVTGVRADGTVAIIGDDMPHLPCVDTVRRWQNIAQVTSSTCSVYALDQNDCLITVGRNNAYGGGMAAKLCGNEPILLDAQGGIMPETWSWATDGQYDAHYYERGAIGDALCETALGYERMLCGALTKDGRIICVNEFEHLGDHFRNGPYVAADANWSHIVALRKDGGVDAAAAYMEKGNQKCDVSLWQNVVKVVAGADHTLGLRADGTVYYAGNDERHARQIAQWTDVVDLDAGNGYSIALCADGSVMMAGAYIGYDR